MTILLIDNFDSFVHNLARYLRRLGQPTRVERNQAISVDEVLEYRPQAIVISPGPRSPQDAGISLEVVHRCSGIIPILGVCLGHQTIGAAFGGRIGCAAPCHGRASRIVHNGSGVFAGLPSPMEVARYHSLIVEPADLPACLEITATTEDGLVMGLRHREHLTFGVQFHPESVLSPSGFSLLANFLELAGLQTDRGKIATSSMDAILPEHIGGCPSPPAAQVTKAATGAMP